MPQRDTPNNCCKSIPDLNQDEDETNLTTNEELDIYYNNISDNEDIDIFEPLQYNEIYRDTFISDQIISIINDDKELLYSIITSDTSLINKYKIPIDTLISNENIYKTNDWGMRIRNMVASSDGNVVLIQTLNGMFISNNGGKDFDQLAENIDFDTRTSPIAISGNGKTIAVSTRFFNTIFNENLGFYQSNFLNNKVYLVNNNNINTSYEINEIIDLQDEITSIKISNDGNIIVLASTTGVWKSTNKGDEWDKILKENLVLSTDNLDMSSDGNNIAVSGNDGLTLWLSRDAGEHWHSHSISVSDNFSLDTILRVKISEDGNTIVCLAPSDLGPYNIFVSIDGGNSFKPIKQENYGINAGFLDISTSGNYIYIAGVKWQNYSESSILLEIQLF
jgi:photosystem II stability/assembly factor-like uncharacterized protein